MYRLKENNGVISCADSQKEREEGQKVDGATVATLETQADIKRLQW